MPLNLITTIQADATLNAAFLAEDDATLLAGLNARTVQQPVAVASPRDLLTGLGTDLADTLLGIMESTNNVTKAFKQRMIQSGLEFDDPVTQTMLQALQRHPQWPADATAKLQGLSVKVMSPVERDHGEGQTATQEDVDFTRKLVIVSACRASMKAIADPVKAKDTALNGWLDIYDVIEHSLPEVRSYCDDLLISDDGNPTRLDAPAE